MPPKTAKANVTPIRQRTQFTCMSTSMAMALQALGQTHCDEDTVNKVMGAQPMRGASWENALACAQHFGMRATLTSPCTVKQLKAWTDAGTPVLIAWNPEGREWSHASLVFDVDDDGNVWVADPNIPDPDETVRVVPKAEFYSKWFEKWPDYLVRRPAMAIEREITVDGRQVQAGKKELRSQKDKGMSRFLKNGPVRPTEKSDSSKAMEKAQWEARKEQGTAGLPGAGMGAGAHKDKTRYDRKREKNIDREASTEGKSAIFMGLMQDLMKRKKKDPAPVSQEKHAPAPGAPRWRDLKESTSQAQPLMTRRDYGVTAMLNTTNFQRILKMAEDLPGPVEDYVKEVQEANPDYSEGQAWATAWSIYCKYKNPGSEHCQQSPSEYFKAAAQKIAGMSKKAGYTHYWELKEPFTPEEWKKLMVATRKILLKAAQMGIVVRGASGVEKPSVSSSWIMLNGDESTGQAYESFVLEPDAVGTEFCKTENRPYDAVVVSVLAAARNINPLKFLVKSDGGPGVFRKVLSGDITAKFEKGVSMTVDEVAEVVGPEFKEMNENPPDSVVKVMKKMQGKTAAKRTTHLPDPKKPGFNLCGEHSYPNTMADGPRDTTCFYCKSAWEKSHGGHMASEHLSIDMFAEALKEAKFEEGKPADPTENMSEEDAAEWHRQNDEHKDEFKGASTPAQRSDDENNAVVENFFHKSAAQPQGAAQKAIMGYLESHEPGEYALTDMARTMRGMHFKSILSAAQALSKNGLVSFDGVNVSTAKGASKTADMSDLWVGWIEDPEGYMARFFAPTPRGAVKRQVMKAVNDVGIDMDWTVMQAGKALKTNLDPNSVSPQWFSRLPSDDKGALRAFLDTAPGITVGKTAATGLYGFTKATEGACGAGVNKLQKAAKKIAANLYAKDESSPSFLSKHAAKGGSKTASMLLKAMESIGPMAQISKTAGKSGTGLYGFSEKTAKLGLSACNDLHHEAGVIAGDLFARKGADPVKVAGYLASHAKKAKCPYAALLSECAPDAPTVIAKKTATDFLASNEEDEIEGNEEVLDIVSKC